MVILGGINFASIDLGWHYQSDQALCLHRHPCVKPVYNSFDLSSICVAVKVMLDLFERSAKIQGKNIAATENFLATADDHGNSSCFILVQIRFLLMLSSKCVDMLESGLDAGNLQDCEN